MDRITIYGVQEHTLPEKKRGESVPRIHPLRLRQLHRMYGFPVRNARIGFKPIPAGTTVGVWKVQPVLTGHLREGVKVREQESVFP